MWDVMWVNWNKQRYKGSIMLISIYFSAYWQQKRHCPTLPLEWRYDERDGVSNYWSHDSLLNRWFRRRSKKTSELRVTDLCEGNSPATGELPAQRASNAENVFIWWRHHGSPSWRSATFSASAAGEGALISNRTRAAATAYTLRTCRRTVSASCGSKTHIYSSSTQRSVVITWKIS